MDRQHIGRFRMPRRDGEVREEQEVCGGAGKLLKRRTTAQHYGKVQQPVGEPDVEMPKVRKRLFLSCAGPRKPDAIRVQFRKGREDAASSAREEQIGMGLRE